MDTSVTVAQQQPIAALDEPAKLPERVTGKVRKAVDLMVWSGLHRDEAAKQAGLAVHSLYQALRRPPVKAYYLDQCEALRTSYRARGIHRMAEVQEQSVNLNAAVAAYKALNHVDASDVARANGNISQTPGFLITIVNQPQPASPHSHALPSTPQQQTIEHQPIDNAKERG